MMNKHSLKSSLVCTLLIAFFAAGCDKNPMSVENVLESMPTTTPTPPQDDHEDLIQKTIERAAVTEKDIPDYGLLKSKSHIVVSSRTSENRVVTSGGLPVSRDVHFALLLPGEIQEFADNHGDFMFLRIGQITLNDDEAIIWIFTRWAVSESSDVVYLSGGGYELKYLRRAGVWTFEAVLSVLIS